MGNRNRSFNIIVLILESFFPFHQEHGVAGGSGTSPRSHLLLSEDLQGAGREGLQATIDKMEVISPPPDFRVTTASEAGRCRPER